ncbi:MAG: hypothetical protein R2769_11560 [Saprospiraceae bacterium]
MIAEEGQPLGNMYGTGFKEYNGEIIFNKGLPQEDSELRLLGTITILISWRIYQSILLQRLFCKGII